MRAERVRRPPPCGAAPYVGPLVLIAFAGIALQVVEMGYHSTILGPPTYWFLIGFGLLMLVQVRRSAFAHGVIIVVSVFGAILYLPGVSHEHGLTVMFVGFVVPLLALSAPPVRRHVQEPRTT
ncbi:MAG: hypothetical protein JWP74_2431 [Marmoricola sp.]|nr:hypothetical protein [Marmoricola sp.]